MARYYWTKFNVRYMMPSINFAQRISSVDMLITNAAASSGFNPYTYGTPLLWLEADRVGKVQEADNSQCEDGDTVKNWYDATVANYLFAQGTAAYRSEWWATGWSPNGIVALPTLRFDGNNDTLSMSETIDDGGSATFACVCKMNGLSGTHFLFDKLQGHNLRLWFEGGAFNVDVYDGTPWVSATPTSHLLWSVVVARFTENGTLYMVYNNEDQMIIDSTSKGTFAHGGQSNWVGSSINGTYPASADIPLICMWSGAMSDANLNAMRIALRNKYGI